MQPIVLQSRHSSPRTNHRFAAILESNTPWATLLVGLLAAVGSGFGPARELFVWDRGAILHGEIWRLVTGHLVHAARGHFLLDV
ncbi:hypothetical protein HYR69_04085, partial [Candidatus Sumerlaeota bacterium]|nr:hypothetical protein [Candidatus Sumerlaeota bacterium]